jgi:hypothetical protein
VSRLDHQLDDQLDEPSAATRTADGERAPAAGCEGGHDATGRGGGRRALLILGLTAVVALPLFVALVALRTPRWYPILDLAMTEMRVRDVGTSHTPLVGLVGRLSSDGNQGSHLGPLSFWSLAPTYRLLGESAWSVLVGVVVLNTTAIGLTLWVALRRGGTALAVGFAAALAVLIHLYGSMVLTEPWNPYIPVLWWTLTLVALWAVLCDDLPMLPVAMFAASFCLQTHISYLGLVGGFAAAALAAFVVRAVRLRDDRPALRRLLRWSGVSLVLGVVLWLPPIIDQVTGDPGNMSIVVGHFAEPEDDPIGVRRGAELFAVDLNPWRLLAGQHAISGSTVPGVLFVLTWLAAALATWRFLPRQVAHRAALLRLHAVIGLALVLGFASAVRILGFIWFYLVLWAWSITMLMAVAVVWTVVLVARPRGATLVPAARVGFAASAAVLVGWTGWFALDARNAEPTQAGYSSILADFTEVTTAAIGADDAPGGGADGRYMITWTDGINLGATGYGLVNELERRGYDVGATWPYGPGVLEHRVMDPDDATAEIHISFGPDIERWDAMPGFDRLIRVDRRTDEQLAEYDAARTRVIEGLREAGLDNLVPVVDIAPFQLYFNDQLPADLVDVVKILNDTGQPAAIYLGPPTSGVTPAAAPPVTAS